MRVSKFIGCSIAWRSRSFAISFLRKRRGTALVGRGWLFFLSFEFRSISLAYSSWIYVSFGSKWREIRGGIWIEWVAVKNITNLLLGWRCYASLRLGGPRSHGSLFPLSSFVRIDVVVDATASYPGFARPRIDVRTRLASLHVPHPALVPKIAHLRIVALLRPVLSIQKMINPTDLLCLSLMDTKIYIGVPDSYIQTVQTCATGAKA